MWKVRNEKQAIILLLVLIALGGIIMYGKVPNRKESGDIPFFMKR